MRILSQVELHDGIIDVPYEQISIEQKENKIWCGYYATLEEHCVKKLFAEYSTTKKAQSAMKMLHENYMQYSHYITSKNDFIPPKVFQFPADNEIEVQQ